MFLPAVETAFASSKGTSEESKINRSRQLQGASTILTPFILTFTFDTSSLVTQTKLTLVDSINILDHTELYLEEWYRAQLKVPDITVHLTNVGIAANRRQLQQQQPSQITQNQTYTGYVTFDASASFTPPNQALLNSLTAQAFEDPVPYVVGVIQLADSDSSLLSNTESVSYSAAEAQDEGGVPSASSQRVVVIAFAVVIAVVVVGLIIATIRDP